MVASRLTGKAIFSENLLGDNKTVSDLMGIFAEISRDIDVAAIYLLELTTTSCIITRD